MFNTAKRDEVLQKFEQDVIKVAQDFSGVPRMYESFASDMLSSVKRWIGILDDKKLPEGVEVGKLSTRVLLYGDSLMNFSVRSSVTGGVNPIKYKFSLKKTEGSTDISLYEELVDNIYNIYKLLIFSGMIDENVKYMNEVLSEICEAADLSYRVQVASPIGHKGDVIKSISEKEIVFVADEERIFNLDNVRVTMEPDETVTMDSIMASRKSVADQYGTALDVVQFLENGEFDLIRYICKISKSRNIALTLRKMSAKSLKDTRKRKAGVYTYRDGDVIGLVKIATDGDEPEVVLNPFNVKTFERVDGIDMLSMIPAKE